MECLALVYGPWGSQQGLKAFDNVVDAETWAQETAAREAQSDDFEYKIIWEVLSSRTYEVLKSGEADWR